MRGSGVRIQVECYAGYRGEQTPRRFCLRDRRVEVAEVLDAWLAPDHRYFKVRGGGGELYLLRHDIEEDCWEMTSTAAGQDEDPR